MNKSVTFVARSIAGGIIGLAVGRVITNFIDTNREIAKSEALLEDFKRKQGTVSELLQRYVDLLEDVPNPGHVQPKTLAERIAGYTEEELFAILDAHDDRMATDHETDLGHCGDPTRETCVERHAWNCKCDDCKAISNLRLAEEDGHQDELNPAPFLAADARLARENARSADRDVDDLPVNPDIEVILPTFGAV